LDSSNKWNHGDFVSGGYEEYRACTLKSNKFNDFVIQISLDPHELGFKINYMNKLTNYYYWLYPNNSSNGSQDKNLIDSINIKNIVYHDIMIIADSSNDFEIYYNRMGILRYIIKNDTFNLKSR